MSHPSCLFVCLFTVALVAGLATGVPVVVLVFIYVVYCCCRRKHQADLLNQEPRLWRRDGRHRSSQDLFIPPYVPRIVQKFVQHSRNSSHTSSTQTSPTDNKSFYGSEDSGSYRTAPDDMGQPEKAPLGSSFENLHLPTARRSSLMQLSTSSGDSSESIYENKKGTGRKSPKNFPQDSKSFEFVRPIPVKPLITITRAESVQKDDTYTEKRRLSKSEDHTVHSHSDSQALPAKKSRDVSRSLDNVAVPSTAGERRGSSDRNLLGRRRSSGGSQGAPAKIPVNISSKVIRSRKDSKSRGSHDIIKLGKLNISLQYKQTTCDLFIKVRRSFWKIVYCTGMCDLIVVFPRN